MTSSPVRSAPRREGRFVRRSFAATLVIAAGVLSMGAEGRGCSAEIETEGRAGDWEFGELPRESANPEPFTCEVLDGRNCWTDLAAELERCVPEDEIGAFSPDGRTCEFPDGTLIEWDGDVEFPDPGETSVPIIQHRILRPSGSPCFTARWLGIANVAYDVNGSVSVLRADSLTTFTMICPDGSTYASDVEGTCEDTGARWLVGGLPGYDVTCDGSRRRCDFLVKGGSTGRTETIASCAF